MWPYCQLQNLAPRNTRTIRANYHTQAPFDMVIARGQFCDATMIRSLFSRFCCIYQAPFNTYKAKTITAVEGCYFENTHNTRANPAAASIDTYRKLVHTAPERYNRKYPVTHLVFSTYSINSRARLVLCTYRRRSNHHTHWFLRCMP